MDEPAAPRATRGRGFDLLILAGIVVVVAAGVVGANGMVRRKVVADPVPSVLDSAAVAGGVPIGGVPSSPRPAPSTVAASSGPPSPSSSATGVTVKAPPARGKPSAGVVVAAATGTATKSTGPLAGYSACTKSGDAAFTVTFTVNFSWHHVFIDTDDRTGTGYRVPQVSLGADYMVEDGTLYRSTGSQWGWTAVDGTSPLVSHGGGTYRWRVPLDAVGLDDRAFRSVFNGSGGNTDAYSPVMTVGAC